MFFPLFEVSDEPGCAQLSDAEIADIATEHELGFHTTSHVRADAVTEDTVHHEVTEAVERITALGGRPPRVGAWRAGARFDEQLLGHLALRDAGIRHLISNWSMERIPPPPDPR